MDQRVGSSSQDVLDPPVPGGRSLSTAERGTVDLSSQIPGWGSDLDLARRPGVPRDKEPALGREALYPDIEPQVARVKIHKSTEHGQLPPVFGTSCPPQGLSGMLRDVAYRFSEGRLTRWTTLLFADRVDVVEGVVGDLARGRVPNLVREMGLASELRHNRAGVARKAGLAMLLVAGAVVLLRRRHR